MRRWSNSRSQSLPRQQRRTVLTVEVLEDRLTPATDIQTQFFQGLNGMANVAVSYKIVGDPAPPFTLDFFRSADRQWGRSDALIKRIAILNAFDRAAGNHLKILPVGPGPNQLPLPGAGPPDAAFYLLAVADSRNRVAEDDAMPQREDNQAVFSGVYHIPGGPVVAHTGEAADLVRLIPSASGLKHYLDVNRKVYAYRNADVTSFSVHTHGGADRVIGGRSTEPLDVWAGAGSDSVYGGRGDDQLNGGLGNDYLNGKDGNDNLFGESGRDILETSLGRDNLRPGGGGDRIIWTPLVRAAATTPVKVWFTAFVAGYGHVVGEGSGTLDINVSGNGRIGPAGNLTGAFSANGRGRGGDGTCPAIYWGTASGSLRGPLSTVGIQGTASGHYVIRCPDGTESGTEREAFRGTASFTGDALTVRVTGDGFAGSGRGEFGLVTTSTIG